VIFTDHNVDIPDTLLNSLTRDELVIFVGAGVSARAYPRQKPGTCYPTFSELVCEIGEEIGRTLTVEERRLLKAGFADRILGEWHHDGGDDIKAITARILTTNEDQQRLELHRTIVRLFPRSSSPRIVTTNVDHLLIRARDKEGFAKDSRWQSHSAPSLPPAKRFTGICFLHGTVALPSEMVLTDKDIGRAYMDEGWALSFAHNMFKEFDVLFVGYSLEDPPLRYLSLALEASGERKRWAFLAEPKHDKRKMQIEREWKRRNVDPIWFPTPKKDYRALEMNLQAWGEDNSRTFVDRRNVLRTLAGSDPTHLEPHNLDRARYFLEDNQLLRDFVEFGIHQAWFDKLLDWGHLEVVLRAKEGWREADGALCERIVQWLIEEPTTWVSKLAPFRNALHEQLFFRFCWFLQSKKPPSLSAEIVATYLDFFRPCIESQPVPVYALQIHFLLDALLKAKCVDKAIWLFTSILRTKTDIRRQRNLEFDWLKQQGKDTAGYPEFKLEFDTQFGYEHIDHVAQQYIDSLFKPRIAELGYQLLQALTVEFLKVQGVLERCGVKPRYGNFYRAAIELPVANIRTGEPPNFLIDILRDLWEEALNSDRASAEAIYHLWLGYHDVYLQKLAIHAARKMVESK
jgi:SIR2-like domain